MRRWTVLLLGILLFPLGGCEAPGFLPYARELEDMALMRTLGVDAAGENGVVVTVSTGEQAGGEEPVVLSGTAGTISGACLDMQSQGSSYIYYGHVGQLLLGEQLAARGVGNALEYVLRDIEMRLDTEVYLIRGAEAGPLIQAAAEAGGSATDRLEAMEEDAGLLSYSMPRTVGDVLIALERSGAAFVPALESGEEGELEAAGYGIIKDGVLVGWAEGEAAWGVNLLSDRVDADVLELEGAALRVVGARTTIRPVFEGERLTRLTITCSVDANLAEAPSGIRLQNRDMIEELERALEERERIRIQTALELSAALDADFMELRQAACLAAPWYKTEIDEQWRLTDLEIETSVVGTILRGYDVKD